MKPYTKAQLQELVYCQLENLDAMHDLLKIIKHQNELLASANKKLSEEILDTKPKQVAYGNKRKSPITSKT